MKKMLTMNLLLKKYLTSKTIFFGLRHLWNEFDRPGVLGFRNLPYRNVSRILYVGLYLLTFCPEAALVNNMSSVVDIEIYIYIYIYNIYLYYIYTDIYIYIYR